MDVIALYAGRQADWYIQLVIIRSWYQNAVKSEWRLVVGNDRYQNPCAGINN